MGRLGAISGAGFYRGAFEDGWFPEVGFMVRGGCDFQVFGFISM